MFGFLASKQKKMPIGSLTKGAYGHLCTAQVSGPDTQRRLRPHSVSPQRRASLQRSLPDKLLNLALRGQRSDCPDLSADDRAYLIGEGYEGLLQLRALREISRLRQLADLAEQGSDERIPGSGGIDGLHGDAWNQHTGIRGKLYGIPMVKDIARKGVILRKDWLDKLGLQVPQTTDELMQIAKAFTEEDPDGNGSKDTTGFIDRSDLVFGAFKTLGFYFGTPSSWDVDDSGKVTPEFESEGYVKAMEYMKELY